MKKKLFVISLLVLSFAEKTIAQDSIPTVERSIKGIQVGETGLIFNYEFKLTNNIALRTEAGFTAAFFSDEKNIWTGQKEKSSTVVLPTFTIEPRWYYNLNRRVRKGKDITRNRANYFSLFLNYTGGWGAVKFDNRVDQVPDFICISPMWGMRRTLGEHFNYELGGGVGYNYITKYDHFDHSHRSDDGITAIVRLRFGFDL